MSNEEKGKKDGFWFVWNFGNDTNKVDKVLNEGE